jgi:hypothetical protein
MQMRGSRDAVALTFIGAARDTLYEVFHSFTSLLADDFAWISAEFSEQDTNTFAPATPPDPVVGTIEDWLTEWSPVKRVSFIEFSGRAVGSRTSVKVYGLDIDNDGATDLGATGVIGVVLLPGIAGAITNLEANARAGSGAPTIWYDRVTHKTNDRLLKSVRRGFIAAAPGA